MKRIITSLGRYHPLPNIEYPDHLIISPGDRPEPAGFASIDGMWEPRFSKTGTYNKKYVRERIPGLPDDFDWAYFNAAPADQQIDSYFDGDEAFEIHNMHPLKPVIQGELPGVYGRIFVE